MICTCLIICRPGALIAGTWAAMQYMGSEYVVLSILYANKHLPTLLSITVAILSLVVLLSTAREPSPTRLKLQYLNSISWALPRLLLLPLPLVILK